MAVNLGNLGIANMSSTLNPAGALNGLSKQDNTPAPFAPQSNIQSPSNSSDAISSMLQHGQDLQNRINTHTSNQPTGSLSPQVDFSSAIKNPMIQTPTQTANKFTQ